MPLFKRVRRDSDGTEFDFPANEVLLDGLTEVKNYPVSAYIRPSKPRVTPAEAAASKEK